MCFESEYWLIEYWLFDMDIDYNICRLMFISDIFYYFFIRYVYIVFGEGGRGWLGC